MDHYKEQIKLDIRDWANENRAEIDRGEMTIDEVRDALQLSDSVTGNASGSYFCNAYKAQQTLNESEVLWDWDFITWLKDLGFDLGTTMEKGPENMDVLARCCALDQIGDDELANITGFKRWELAK